MNYTDRITKAQSSFPGEPAIWIICISHDDWCPRAEGLGDCVCDPTIHGKNTETGREYEITQTGELIPAPKGSCGQH